MRSSARPIDSGLPIRLCHTSETSISWEWSNFHSAGRRIDSGTPIKFISHRRNTDFIGVINFSQTARMESIQALLSVYIEIQKHQFNGRDYLNFYRSWRYNQIRLSHKFIPKPRNTDFIGTNLQLHCRTFRSFAQNSVSHTQAIVLRTKRNRTKITTVLASWPSYRTPPPPKSSKYRTRWRCSRVWIHRHRRPRSPPRLPLQLPSSTSECDPNWKTKALPIP